MSNMTWQNYIDSEYNVEKYDINGTSYKEFMTGESSWGESDLVWYASIYNGKYADENFYLYYYDINGFPDVPRLNDYIIDGMDYIAS